MLRTQIHGGHLRPGAQLPSQRAHVGLQTIERAQSLLVGEGLLDRSTRGVFVTDHSACDPLELPGLDDLVPLQPAPAASPLTHRRVPRYLQLTDLLEQMIAEGAFPPGTRMPFARQVAQQYGYTANCAQHALRLLRERGLTVAGPRSATYVARRELASPGRQAQDPDRSPVGR
nr:GntR family transcriptional regulator [Streptomyces sp. SID4917]